MAEPVRERRVAVQAARAQALPGQVRQRRERVEQHVMALAGDHRGDAEQSPGARGPGREAGSIDSGLGDVHAVAGQLVQLPQRSPGPPAGRDDGGGSREHRALPSPGVVIAGSWPSGMCTRVTSRNLFAWGTNTSGAVEATRPSSSTTASSGIPWMTPARAAYDAASGRGQEPGTACSRTDQPVSASPRQTRRS